MKRIILDIQSGLYARTIQRMLLQELEEYHIIISESPSKTVERCKMFRPYALLMEVTGYTPWINPDCKVVMLVDDVADKALAESVKQAKRDGLIDAFLFGSVTEQYMAAVMDSL